MKSLGRIAYEARHPPVYRASEPWPTMTPSAQNKWDAVGRAVQDEVLRRLKQEDMRRGINFTEAVYSVLAGA